MTIFSNLVSWQWQVYYQWVDLHVFLNALTHWMSPTFLLKCHWMCSLVTHEHSAWLADHSNWAQGRSVGVFSGTLLWLYCSEYFSDYFLLVNVLNIQISIRKKGWKIYSNVSGVGGRKGRARMPPNTNSSTSEHNGNELYYATFWASVNTDSLLILYLMPLNFFYFLHTDITKMEF